MVDNPCIKCKMSPNEKAACCGCPAWFEYNKQKSTASLTSNPCPLVSFCNAKTAVCHVIEPDDGCYYCRYFKKRINEVENKNE